LVLYLKEIPKGIISKQSKLTMNLNIQHSFKALADPTRRQILVHLSQQEMTIAEITDQFDMTRAAIKKHLNILESGSLISVKTNGRERINSLEAEGLRTITDWLSYFDQFWDKKLSLLQTAITNNENDINKES
jgi:DNA-binding transcriptional ArsR family regulator